MGPTRRDLVSTGLAALLPWPGSPQLRGAPSAAAAGGGMGLGVQTHFSQRWRLPWIDRARDVGATILRDGLSWRAIETRPGQYRFDPYHCDFLDTGRRKGMRFLLCIDPRHPVYDKGDTAYTPQAMEAFADYLAALLDRYGDVVMAIEVGNEINGQRAVTGRAAKDRAASHVALLAVIRDRVKPRHPDIMILGGSTNVIGVGFLETVFAAGGLEVMDGVAVHPYRSHPEHVDVELLALNAAMARHGRILPIFATEFSDAFLTPERASPHMVKMVTLMAAAGVSQAFWYALSDQRWFQNMGLFTAQQTPKPAAETFDFLQSALLPHDRPSRVQTDDLAYVYRYGAAATVLWGAPREIRIVGPGRAHDARGRPIALPTQMSPEPVVILGDVRVELRRSAWIADSFYQFGRSPWSYFARTREGGRHPLDWVYWDWTSYIGDTRFRPLAFNPEGLAVSGHGDSAVEAVLEYSADSARKVRCQTVLSHSGEGDGLMVSLRLQDRELRGFSLKSQTLSFSDEIEMKRGDVLSLVINPRLRSVGDRVKYRLTVYDLEP